MISRIAGYSGSISDINHLSTSRRTITASLNQNKSNDVFFGSTDPTAVRISPYDISNRPIALANAAGVRREIDEFYTTFSEQAAEIDYHLNPGAPGSGVSGHRSTMNLISQNYRRMAPYLLIDQDRTNGFATVEVDPYAYYLREGVDFRADLSPLEYGVQRIRTIQEIPTELFRSITNNELDTEASIDIAAVHRLVSEHPEYSVVAGILREFGYRRGYTLMDRVRNPSVKRFMEDSGFLDPDALATRMIIDVGQHLLDSGREYQTSYNNFTRATGLNSSEYSEPDFYYYFNAIKRIARDTLPIVDRAFDQLMNVHDIVIPRYRTVYHQFNRLEQDRLHDDEKLENLYQSPLYFTITLAGTGIREYQGTILSRFPGADLMELDRTTLQQGLVPSELSLLADSLENAIGYLTPDISSTDRRTERERQLDSLRSWHRRHTSDESA